MTVQLLPVVCLTLFVSVFAIASGNQHRKELNQDWESWKNRHGKVYETPDEERFRRSVWDDRWQFVWKHNERKAEHGFEVEMNNKNTILLFLMKILFIRNQRHLHLSFFTWCLGVGWGETSICVVLLYPMYEVDCV